MGVPLVIGLEGTTIGSGEASLAGRMWIRHMVGVETVVPEPLVEEMTGSRFDRGSSLR